MTAFQPVLLGTETCAYGMARAFHELYGLRSIAFGRARLRATQRTRIMDFQIDPEFGETQVFIRTLQDFGRRWREQHPDVPLLLVSCGDNYSELVAQHRDALHEFFLFRSNSPQLLHQLSQKHLFYQLCQEHGITYPLTWYLHPQQVQDDGLSQLEGLVFPLIVKPSDSITYQAHPFPGREKVYCVDDYEQLQRVVTLIYDGPYQGELVLQRFIPGGDEVMRVVNIYLDEDARPLVSLSGQIVLADPAPHAIGNYAAIVPEVNPQLIEQAVHFLRAIGYRGCANMDFKFDRSSGEFNLFEINVRPGRTNYFTTINDCSLAQALVTDLIGPVPLAQHLYRRESGRMLLEFSSLTLFRYAWRQRRLWWPLLRSGRFNWTLNYHKDRGLGRLKLLFQMRVSGLRRFLRHHS